MKIAVIGAGYVGIATAILMAQHNEVILYDIKQTVVDSINSRQYLNRFTQSDTFLNTRNDKISATEDLKTAVCGADIVFISVPTDYCDSKECFDTRALEDTIRNISCCSHSSIIVIRSTLPVGFLQSFVDNFSSHQNIVYYPEFLSETTALHDIFNPSRIVIGIDNSSSTAKCADIVVKQVLNCCCNKEVPVLIMSYSEAESVKLFSNAYLALRVSFFNEVDSFAELNGCDSSSIIKGICHDPRIGLNYNNPGFGYGGYCLPKDTKQLLSCCKESPNDIISAIVKSNTTRKTYIANRIKTMVDNSSGHQSTIGFYRLIAKKGSDNFRESSVIDIIKHLVADGMCIIIFEPLLKEYSFMNCQVINDIETFKSKSDVIVANRIEPPLATVINKVYTRDAFGYF